MERNYFTRTPLALAVAAALATTYCGLAVAAPAYLTQLADEPALDSTEVQVNTSTMPTYQPAVAMDSNGDFVVAWSTPSSLTSFCKISARLYRHDGAPLSDELTVHTHTSTACYGAVDVAMDAAGDFVVAWSGFNANNTSVDVYARRYDSTGTAQGGLITVDASTATVWAQPSVAMDADGDFAVAWTDSTPPNQSFIRRFDKTGAPGAIQLISDNTTLSNRSPDIAMDADGNITVAWNRDNTSVLARHFPVSGPPGSETSLYNTTASPIVACDNAGICAVSQYAYGSSAVLLRLYDPSLQQLANLDFATTGSNTMGAHLAMSPVTGDVLVSWSQVNASNKSETLIARFDKQGNQLTGPTLVNVSLDGAEYSGGAAVAMDDEGDAVVTWEPDESPFSGTSSTNNNSYYRRFGTADVTASGGGGGAIDLLFGLIALVPLLGRLVKPSK